MSGSLNLGAPSSPDNWEVGLNAWIIQDGNYPDFEVGQTAEFALEFWLPDGVIKPASGVNISAKNVRDCLYEAVADVLVRTDQITILDIGVLVYQQTSPQQPPLSQGSQVAIQLELRVEPFHNFESLRPNGDVLPLVYSWKILSILRQTAPFVETVGEGGKVQVRDPQRLGYEEILKTDAWNDDDGHAEYLLRCNHLPVPPKRVSATAT